jgi:hypothetical protein
VTKSFTPVMKPPTPVMKSFTPVMKPPAPKKIFLHP